MRLSLAAKMFAALFGISAIMVALVVVWIGWALNEGFSTFVSETALTGLDRSVETLQEAYATRGNWSAIAGNNAAWEGALRQATLPRRPPNEFPGPPPDAFGPPGGSARPPPAGEGPGGPEAPPGMLRRLRERLALLDSSGQLVMGTLETLRHPARRPILVKGVRVGELLLDIGPLPGGIEAGFLAQRFRDLYLAGGAAVLLSALAAILLARHILAPIRLVTEGARLLASGDFTTRIEATRRDELGDLVNDFNALARALETSEQSRRLWVADTSHELRTPLAVLRAQIEALQDGVRPADERALAILHGEIVRMTKLVGDLHELSRADSGALALRLEKLDPGAVMAEVLASFAVRREARGLRLDVVNWQGAAAPVLADPDRLRQVFGNVVENSIRYTDAGGVIRVAETGSGNEVSITVEDSSPGVPPAKLPRIFDRFFRAEMSRSRETGGSGLGLSICKAIMEAHAGTIRAAPSPLGGLAVTMVLPAAPDMS